MSVLLFTCSWWENNMIYTFPKSISTMWKYKLHCRGLEVRLPCSLSTTLKIIPQEPRLVTQIYLPFCLICYSKIWLFSCLISFCKKMLFSHVWFAYLKCTVLPLICWSKMCDFHVKFTNLKRSVFTRYISSSKMCSFFH